ncbi:hypothetical protein [Lysobacter tyrosinilyticus]
MRLKPPPPDVCMPWSGAQGDLLRAVATALSAVATHEHAVARAMSLPDPGAIDLPDGAPNAMDAAQLQAAGPLYFAGELEQAGLLRCAELITGLFASGTITQPLGPIATQLNRFWRGRHERLEQAEREAIFARVLEPPHFERLMSAMCAAIVAEADGSDLREGVTLATTAQSLAEFLAQRVDPMASIAARDMVDTINSALGFLRDRMLQAAFGVHSLWSLLAVSANSGAQLGTASNAGDVQRHAERGRAGQSVLLWLASHYGESNIALDMTSTDDTALVMSAQRWLDAAPHVPISPAGTAPALPIAA